MDSVDLNVLRSVLEWRRAGQQVVLYSVVQTWGSAPRPPGAMLALRGDGVVIGSVSGGCIEDDLIARLQDGRLAKDGPPVQLITCLLYTSPSPRDRTRSRMPSSA